MYNEHWLSLAWGNDLAPNKSEEFSCCENGNNKVLKKKQFTTGPSKWSCFFFGYLDHQTKRLSGDYLLKTLLHHWKALYCQSRYGHWRLNSVLYVGRTKSIARLLMCIICSSLRENYNYVWYFNVKKLSAYETKTFRLWVDVIIYFTMAWQPWHPSEKIFDVHPQQSLFI